MKISQISIYKYSGLLGALVLIAAFGAILGLIYSKERPLSHALAGCAKSGVVGGDLGGDFSLIAETGTRMQSAEIFSKPTLLYFGYSFCPDICPIDAARNAEASDKVKSMGLDIQPVFITIDPLRDTPDILTEFTDYLHPEMVGFTGSEADIAKAAKAFRVYYQKQESDDPAYYLMDHSVLTYLILPEYGFVDFFRRDATASEIAEKTACYLKAV